MNLNPFETKVLIKFLCCGLNRCKIFHKKKGICSTFPGTCREAERMLSTVYIKVVYIHTKLVSPAAASKRHWLCNLNLSYRAASPICPYMDEIRCLKMDKRIQLTSTATDIHRPCVKHWYILGNSLPVGRPYRLQLSTRLTALYRHTQFMKLSIPA